MTADEIVARLRGALGEHLGGLEQRSPRRIYAEIAPGDVVIAARAMLGELGARFQIASGVDTAGGIEVLYHWALDRAGVVVTLRTRVDRDAPALDSIATVCPAAEWIEREIWELLGVAFRGHPDLRHLLLDEDWPAGKYPLRRDYER